MSSISKSNNSYSLLAGNATFTGLIEKLPLNDISITVALTIDQPVSVVINQYRNSSETSKVSEIIQAVSIGDTGLVQVPIIGLWANISVTNTSPTNMTSTSITTFFQTTNYANINIRDLTDTRDKINMMGLSPTNTQIQIALDADGRLITSGGGGGDASLWSEFPALQDVDMNEYGLINVNGISGFEDKALNIIADGQLGLISNSGVVLTSKTEIILAIPPESSVIIPPLPTKTLTYDVNGDLTFAEGTQNLSNELGTTTSNSFTLTQSGGGVITFEDGTTQSTAGGGGNFSTPSNQDLDMDSHKIINITELGGVPSEAILVNTDITFNTVGGNYINNVANIVGNNVGGTDPYLQISNLTSILTPAEIQVNATGGVGFYNGTNLNLHEGIISDVSQLQFSDTSIQTTAYQNPFQTQLDMNGQNIIRTTQIFGNSDITVTAGSADIAESSTLSLKNNGYAIAGTYSQLFLKPTGVELNTGDITLATDYKATLDTEGVFTAPSLTLQSGGGGSLTFANDSVQTVAYTGADVQTITSTDGSVTITTPSANTVNLSVPTPQGITSNTFYVNDGVNNVNDVLPSMGAGDIIIVSAGSFGQATNIDFNVAQTGLSGSVAPLPLSFLTTANASTFTVSATQVRIANMKFQLPVFLSGNNCTVDNCDFDSSLTIGAGVTGYITISNCEFIATSTISVVFGTTAGIVYFINCNFLGATITLSQASLTQVIFNNCAGFTTYPANALYVGINVLSAGTAQMNTDTIKSVTPSGNVKYASQINMDGNNLINVNNIGGRTADPVAFTNGLELAAGGGNFNVRNNSITTIGTYTQTCSGAILASTVGSSTVSRHLVTTSIPFFAGGGSATFVYNDAGVFATKSVTLTTGGVITYPDTTTQNSGLIKGTATLVAGTVTITDARVTTGAICVVSYADSPPVGGVLCAKVTAGQIVIESTLLADVSPIFFMYFI